MLRMVLGGAPADPQLRGNPGVGQAACHELGDFHLPPRQPEPRAQFQSTERCARRHLHVDDHGATLSIQHAGPEPHRMQPIPGARRAHLAARGVRPSARVSPLLPLGDAHHLVRQRHDRTLEPATPPGPLAGEAALQAHRLVHGAIGGRDEHRAIQRIK
ncbi:MAG TPA: hypothetical protein VFS33_03545 [Gemmatimonadales bacterium]|nr:hypothetical protein [Gemmatimonadales bacterium]